MKSIKHLEMTNHVSPYIKIDSFQAKLGRDEDVSVIQLQSDNKQVAEDLVDFIESGHKNVLDADFSPAKNTQKMYNIFVELERNDDLPKNIMELIRDIEKTTGILPWKFSFYKNESTYKLSEENLNNQIPTSSDQYLFLIDDKVDEDINELFGESSVKVTREGKQLTLDKKWTKHKFIIESMNVPGDDIKGIYKIDQNSSSQSSYINSWLGGSWSVVKLNDMYKIAKGKKNIIVKSEEI